MKQTAAQLKGLLLQNPATSYWLREQLKKADLRDPCDMARDADQLLGYCKAILADARSNRAQEIAEKVIAQNMKSEQFCTMVNNGTI